MKSIKFLTMILTISLIVTGCNSNKEKSKSEEAAQSAVNSELIHLTMVNPKTINPIINKDKSVGYITNLIYDGLFTIDENYDVVPQLVKEYEVASDGMSVNLKLKDAKWHDGSNITAYDVEYTINLIQKNTDSPYNVFTQNISSVSARSSNEINIKFKEMYAFSMETLIFPIVSKNQLSSYVEKDVVDYKKNLVGNGPYKIAKYQDRNGIILEVNKDYYGKLPENMKDIQVGVVPDEESQVSLVMALESDIANVSLNDLSKFYEKEFNITNYEGREYEYVIFNYNNELLKDVNFRKAIAHSINKQKILEEGYMEKATLVNFPLNSNSKYYDKSFKPLEYNKDEAKKCLEKVAPSTGENLNSKSSKETQAKNKSNDTSKNNSNSLEDVKDNSSVDKEEVKKMISNTDFKIIVNKNNNERVKTAYLIYENLKAIGIKSTVKELDDKELEKALSSKDYDLACIGWELSIIPDARDIIKESGYEDEKLTNYMDSLVKATSESSKQEIYKSIQKNIRDNVAFISLVIKDDYIVKNRRLDGKITPNDFDVYEGIGNLNIKSEQK